MLHSQVPVNSLECAADSSAESCRRVAACNKFAVALVLSALLILATPSFAFADVRNSDVISGLTVQQRGLAAASCPNIVANHAIVVSDDGTVYFERDADLQVQIASVTKTMSAIVALENGDLKNTQITVSKNAASIGESSAMLQAGDVMDLESALKAMMICSGNDAATAIAESMGAQVKQNLNEAGDPNVPDDPFEAFVYAMNKKAKNLGMTDSLFANPHGLDFDQYSADMHCSARDVAIMAAEAMKDGTFRSIVSTESTTIQVQRNGASADVALSSTDVLLGEYEGACGIKTGYTDKAGECFAGAVERNGKTLYAIVLDSSTESQRFVDAKALDEWVYTNTIDYPLVHSSETSTYTDSKGNSVTVPVVANVSHTGWMDKTFKATLKDPEATVSVFTLDGNISQEVTYDSVSGDVSPGQKVGTVTFYQHNEVVAQQDLVAAESCSAPNLIEGIGIWWDRLWKGFSGEQTQAESTLVSTTPLIYGANAEQSTN